MRKNSSGAPDTTGEYWASVYDIKEKLREIVRYRESKADHGLGAILPNAVNADRAQGKTTALVQFVAERTLMLGPLDKIVVLAPTEDIAYNFNRVYERNFPTLRVPIILSIGTENAPAELNLRGINNIKEVYAEEMFLMDHKRVAQFKEQFGLTAGVGTLPRPVILSIYKW
jgi:hypothetical protein